MTTHLTTLAAAFALVSCGVLPAHAHATIGNKEARIGADYEASFEIPHGCAGQPTIEVIVQIPAGYLNVTPVEVPGWQSATKIGSYGRPYKLDSTTVDEGVIEVSWTDGSLPNHEVETFKLTGTFADDLTPGSVYFPMIQVCPDGEEAWIDTSGHSDQNPAPSVTLSR